MNKPVTSRSAEPASADFVQSLARGLAVIKAFDSDHPELSLSEVARRSEMPAAAARRFLRTLETLGYVYATGRSFMLAPRVLELGFSYLSALSLPEVMQPHLERLSAEVGESVSAAVLSGSDIVYVARVPARRIMSVRISIGTRFPAYATSMGRVLLAFASDQDTLDALVAEPPRQLTDRTLTRTDELLAEFAQVRDRGWALNDGELEEGLRSIAVPIRGRDGRVVAAVNISTSATRDSVEHLMEHHLPLALAAAADIEVDLRLL
ncbi:IclR family pca regulon transcriptional regulator [Leucobacter exalbidus]|uniref:IclR family pca regulon transcriptional regulator n=1 Tax=Leucobacter exalbidus TaxID=662960 RepID=A0A940PTZ8_9MICO|nr:IclR family pca regulon transcriptional regulator [Leucobacter exalbidus]